MGVKGALSSLFPAGDGDSHQKSIGAAQCLPLPVHRLGDHLAGHPVNGPLAHRLVETRPCHPAYTFSAADGDGIVILTRNPSHNGQTMGGVDIVPAIFNDSTLGPALSQLRLGERHLHPPALGGVNSHQIGRAACEQQPHRSGSGQCGTGAGGVAAAQAFSSGGDVVLKGHGSPPQAS